MTLKDFAKLARSARAGNTRQPAPLGQPMAGWPADPPRQARSGVTRPAVQTWKNWGAVSSGHLPWIALVLALVVFAGFYVRW